MPAATWLVIAVSFWGIHAPGLTPSCGQPTVSDGDLSAYRTTDGPAIYVDAYAFTDTCSIVLDETALDERDVPLVERCSLVIHEYGHLLGLAHSADPNDIMYPAVPWQSVCEPPPPPVSAAPATAPTVTAHRHRARHRCLVALRSPYWHCARGSAL